MATIYPDRGSAETWKRARNERTKTEPEELLAVIVDAEFWETTLQLQSEFLAVGSFSVFAIYLRQCGSPESKLVGAAHPDTGVES